MGTWSTSRAPRVRPNRASGTSWGSASARRAHDRLEFTGRATITAGERRIRSTTGDLSEAGAFVHTSMPPEMGERVIFTVKLDDGLTLATEASVAWIDRDEDGHPTGCGLAFVALSSTTRMALREHLQPKPEPTPVMVEEEVTSIGSMISRFVDRIAG